MKSSMFAALVLSFSAVVAHGQAKVVYLSCDLSSADGKPSRHFDFTLDESKGTISYYVPEANNVIIEQAVFGPDTVIWAMNDPSLRTTGRLDRTNLSYIQLLAIGSKVEKRTGSCKVITPPDRKF